MMDGFAIRASDWKPGVEFEIGETIIAGAVPTAPLGSLQAARIMTGAPLPVGADAVVMVELAEVKNEQTVTFQIESIAAEKHILRTGANFACGQRLFEAGHRVRPSDVGLLAEVGVSQARVGGLPTIAVMNWCPAIKPRAPDRSEIVTDPCYWRCWQDLAWQRRIWGSVETMKTI